MNKRHIIKFLTQKTKEGRSIFNKAAIAEILGIPRQNVTSGFSDGSLADKHLPKLEKFINSLKNDKRTGVKKG